MIKPYLMLNSIIEKEGGIEQFSKKCGVSNTTIRDIQYARHDPTKSVKNCISAFADMRWETLTDLIPLETKLNRLFNLSICHGAIRQVKLKNEVLEFRADSDIESKIFRISKVENKVLNVECRVIKSNELGSVAMRRVVYVHKKKWYVEV